MKVLLSIKPTYVEKIFAGTKKVEYRRRIFKQKIEKVIIYATIPVGRVVGEFEIEEIIKDTPTVLWQKTKHDAGVEKKSFDDYFSEVEFGYAIKINKTKRYKQPILLHELDCLIKHAPQSFRYID